jgi:uncharacterized phage-associated protein
MSHDARAIGNILLDCADKLAIPISPMKLQKLLYFAHGHSWRALRAGLIFNSFRAWDYGPIVKVVYDEFKDLGSSPICRRANWYNLAAGGVEVAFAALSDEEMACVHQAMSIYAPVDAYTLSRLSHAHNSPWDIVRRKPQAYPKNLIPNELIADYFVNRFPHMHKQ